MVNPPVVAVLTVDHGLRAASAAEAVQVGEWASPLGLPHHILRWEGAKPESGLQAKAREARYDLMIDWCRVRGVGVLLTAHTVEDQAETVLMRLARTASIDSLAGIYRHGSWKGVALFRPLLGEKRLELQSYLRAVGQPWIDDPSNEDERFERVRIRKAMPVLRELGIGAEALADLAFRAQEASQALWGATEDWVKLHAKEYETGYCTVETEAFAAQTPVLQMRILGWLVSRYGAGKMPEPGERELLAAWLATGASGRRTLGGAVVVRRKRIVLIGREPGRIDPAPVAVPASGRVIWDGRFDIDAEPGSLVRPMVVAGPRARREDIPAFVQDSLPVISCPGGGTIFPHLAGGRPDQARFRCRLVN